MKNFKLATLIIFVFTILALVIFSALERFVEPKIADFYTRILTNTPANENVVIVMIDQKSINKMRWPWKRSMYAHMSEFVRKYGQAKVIVFDMLLYSPDEKVSDNYFYSEIRNCDNCIGAFLPISAQASETKMTKEEFDIISKKSQINVTYTTPTKISKYNDILKIIPEYLNSMNSFGYVVIPNDEDGTIRNAYPILKIRDKSYPMLAFAAYAKYKNLESFTVDNDYLYSNDDAETLKIKIWHSIFARDPYLRIKWYKKADEMTTHKTYSAIDIIESLDAIKNGKAPIINPEEFKDKIVIIGAAAKVKSLEDIKTTPIINNMHAGADIQATIISNLLDNSAMNYLSIKQKLGIAFLVMIIAVWIMCFNTGLSLIALSTLMTSYFILATYMFSKGTILQIVTPIVLILLVLSAGFIFKFLVEGHKKEQIQNAMGMYLSKDIMKSVVKNIDNIQRGGKRANITVLFADIRGFTSISEKLSADEVTEILNEYFTAVEPIIRKHNGFINKFIGDAVMAIFGEPIQDKNHALNAVKCANEMHKEMIKLQQKWDEEGKPHIEIGIAINTGEAFVGNIGSPERIEYTVIGDTVNTASRIESYNRVYKTRFLISETTYEKVSRICDVIKIREVPIRGKSKKINLYEVLRIIEKNDN